MFIYKLHYTRTYINILYITYYMYYVCGNMSEIKYLYIYIFININWAPYLTYLCNTIFKFRFINYPNSYYTLSNITNLLQFIGD